jgi:hypothetical protein
MPEDDSGEAQATHAPTGHAPAMGDMNSVPPADTAEMAKKSQTIAGLRADIIKLSAENAGIAQEKSLLSIRHRNVTNELMAAHHQSMNANDTCADMMNSLAKRGQENDRLIKDYDEVVKKNSDLEVTNAEYVNVNDGLMQENTRLNANVELTETRLEDEKMINTELRLKVKKLEEDQKQKDADIAKLRNENGEHLRRLNAVADLSQPVRVGSSLFEEQQSQSSTDNASPVNSGGRGRGQNHRRGGGDYYSPSALSQPQEPRGGRKGRGFHSYRGSRN